MGILSKEYSLPATENYLSLIWCVIFTLNSLIHILSPYYNSHCFIDTLCHNVVGHERQLKVYAPLRTITTILRTHAMFRFKFQIMWLVILSFWSNIETLWKWLAYWPVTGHNQSPIATDHTDQKHEIPSLDPLLCGQVNYYRNHRKHNLQRLAALLRFRLTSP